MITDGARVSYIGAPDPFVPYEEQGVVLTVAGNSAHVKWDSGKITLVDSRDIVAVRQKSAKVESDIDDSLEVSGLNPHLAESVYNERGPEGLLEALEESGALSMHAEAVEDAVDALTAKIATSGWLKRLDEDARSDMATLVARELLKRLS